MPQIDPSELSQTGFVAGLPAAIRDRILQQCVRRRITRGAALIRFGEPAKTVYFLLRGSLNVVVESPEGREVLYRDFQPGDVIGDFAAIDAASRSADVYAASEVIVAEMSLPEFRQLLADPQVASSEMRSLVGLVRALSRRLYQMSSHAALDRLKTELLLLSKLAPDGVARSISPAPTQTELAARTGSHREAVSRHMNQLERDGLIHREGRALAIPDPGRLRTGDPLVDAAPPSRPPTRTHR
jgi:CRP/FNR family transcriptional regulator, cyclic AMP receptor protein